MGIRISEMEEATTFTADDYVPIVSSGMNKKALGQKIKDFIAGFFVSKSGDTMTGNLTVEKSNGEYRLKNPNVTINTTANNGVTSYQTEGFMIKDSANNDITRFISAQETNGDIIAQIAAFNKKTDGTATNNYINATVKKDGTRTYTVADPAAFRNAIGIDGALTGTAIKSGYIANNTSATIPIGLIGLLCIYRADTSLNAVVSFYGTSKQTIIGNLPSTITISTNTATNSITINNVAGYTIGVTIIANYWSSL